MVEDLGFRARHQKFDTKEEALHDYLQACVRGTVEVVRDPGDSVDRYGPPEDAEDLPID